MPRLTGLALCAAWLLASLAPAPAPASEIVVDCSKSVGEFRPLHGVNGGPLDRGGLIDLSEYHRALAVPLTRLHDSHWPNPDVVDLHVVFPDPRADPEKPESYEFVRTDEYVKAIVAGGSRLVYRLGESIEHGSDKRRLRPPPDPERWAAACVGIVRHYNEGWANGFRYDVRYWEIWNEPDNRPNMWTGSDEDYFRLYATAAKAIKKRFPSVRVGGPAVGNVGRVEWHRDGVDLLRTGPEPLLLPSPFVEKFLAFCKREAAPLDFFSWHLYGDDPASVASHARGVRKLLDRSGFAEAESHLNEWNYLPDNDWGPVLLGGQGAKRRRFYERVGGAEGAAFVSSVLLLMPDCPLDAANYFTADTGEFGLFDRYGVPRKTFHAFKAFRTLLDTPLRVGASWDEPAAASAAAGMSRRRDAVTVLVSRLKGKQGPVQLTVRSAPWGAATKYEVFVLDGDHDLESVRSGTVPAGEARLEIPVAAPGVTLIKLTEVPRRGPG